MAMIGASPFDFSNDSEDLEQMPNEIIPPSLSLTKADK
jgi:hypothetical protein